MKKAEMAKRQLSKWIPCGPDIVYALQPWWPGRLRIGSRMDLPLISAMWLDQKLALGLQGRLSSSKTELQEETAEKWSLFFLLTLLPLEGCSMMNLPGHSREARQEGPIALRCWEHLPLGSATENEFLGWLETQLKQAVPCSWKHPNRHATYPNPTHLSRLPPKGCFFY